jgi:ribose transport system ATP-binding protein/rhamnose transport system ATP-binding protein
MVAPSEIIRFVDVTKDFPGVRALDHVSFSIDPGEIHAIVGENGAGKSTLMKLLTGNYVLRQGEIHIEGHPISFSSYADAMSAGIHMVYQEFSLANDLTLSENVFAGSEPTSRLGLIDYRTMNQRSKELLGVLGVAADPGTMVENLNVAQKQIVEIAKALRQEAKILILDEPTSTLPAKEVQELFRLLRKLRDDGTTIIYITHRLDEVFEISDLITVLRDGEYVGTYKTEATSRDQIIRLQVGQEQLDHFEERETMPPSVSDESGSLLDVRSLTVYSSFSDVSFQLHRGEILGFFGLLGSGVKEVAKCLFGLETPQRGELNLEGAPIRIIGLRDAMRLGIGYLPQDRREQGLFLDMTIEQNIVSAVLSRFIRRGMLQHGAIEKEGAFWSRKLNVVARSIKQRVATLSGGNQQKVCLAKWLSTNPKVLIADEPTAGIDVGAKFEVHAILRAFCGKDNGVILVSSDIEATIRMCDRIVVMRDGKVTGTLNKADFSKERLLSLSL